MTATLAISRAFSPWAAPAARAAAAWLAATGADPVDVVRADLDAVLPRARPRPEIDGVVRHTASVLAPHDPVRWTDLGTYADSALRAAHAWQAAGAVWGTGYSGPAGLADHLSLALLRAEGLVPTWTAQVSDLPTHAADGRRLLDTVEDDALLTRCRRALAAWAVPEPATDLVAHWVLALIAGGAGRIVVDSDDLAAALLSGPVWRDLPALADRVVVWAAAPVPMRQSLGDVVRITGRADAVSLPLLDPVLRAYALLTGDERGRLRLALRTTEGGLVAASLRRHGLEDAVDVLVDDGTPCVAGDFALILDRPGPEGQPCFPGPPADLAEAEAGGIPVILVAPQDSVRTRHPAAHHLPTEHVSAARALFSRLAAAPSPVVATAGG